MAGSLERVLKSLLIKTAQKQTFGNILIIKDWAMRGQFQDFHFLSIKIKPLDRLHRASNRSMCWKPGSMRI